MGDVDVGVGVTVDDQRRDGDDLELEGADGSELVEVVLEPLTSNTSLPTVGPRSITKARLTGSANTSSTCWASCWWVSVPSAAKAPEMKCRGWWVASTRRSHSPAAVVSRSCSGRLTGRIR